MASPPTIEDEHKSTIEDDHKPTIEDEHKPTIKDEHKSTIEENRDQDSDTETIFTEITTTAETSFWGQTAVRDAVPWAGETFIIVDKASGRVITHTNGEIRLEDNTHRKGCWHWLCVEKDGWFGFCNTASGRYLGMNVWGTLQAEVKHHKGWEYFVTRKHPNGGYLLLTTQGAWKLLTVGLDNDGGVVANANNKGIVWEFVKV